MFEDLSVNNAIKLLKSDKATERIKGAKELEMAVRKLTYGEDVVMKDIIKNLTEYTDARSPVHRIGGLIGISSTVIALDERCKEYVSLIIPFIIKCFEFEDNRVRYHACEALTHVANVVQKEIMPFFSQIFDCLYKVSNDPDNSVIGAFTVVDRIVKDIVLSSGYIAMDNFVDTIKSYMYAVNPCTSLFLISWLNVLNGMPDLHLTDFLPDLLDGIFAFLDLKESEIILQTTQLLGNLLDSIESKVNTFDFMACAHIVARNVLDQRNHIKEVAISWMLTFLRLSDKKQLSGLSPNIFEALISCIVTESNTERVVQYASYCFELFIDLVVSQGDMLEEHESVYFLESSQDQLISTMIFSLGSSNTQVRSTTLNTLIKLIEYIPRRIIYKFDSFFTVIFVIFEGIIPSVDAVEIDSLSTSLCFDFIYKIVTSLDFAEIPGVSELSSMEWWNDLSYSHDLSPFFNVFVFRLVKWFKERNEESQISSVVIELAKRVSPSVVFSSISIIISFDKDRSFISTFVKVLNVVMMTCPVFFSLRTSLTRFDSKSAHALFQTLYKTWAYSPISVVTLCLLTKNYSHALWLVEHFPMIELSVDLLVDIDKLIQLLELPVFSYLRLQLIDPNHNASLFKCLYSLLMLMPQTKSFKTLYKRLHSVPPFMISTASVVQSTNIDFEQLKIYFLNIHGLVDK